MFKRATTDMLDIDVVKGDYYAGNVIIRKYRYFGTIEWFVIVDGSLNTRWATLAEAKVDGQKKVSA